MQTTDGVCPDKPIAFTESMMSECRAVIFLIAVKYSRASCSAWLPFRMVVNFSSSFLEKVPSSDKKRTLMDEVPTSTPTYKSSANFAPPDHRILAISNFGP